MIEKQIKIRAGDDLVKVATDFVKENGLEREAALKVYQLVKQSYEMHLMKVEGSS